MRLRLLLTITNRRNLTLKRQLFAEFLGTFVLVMAVVGSGVMATELTNDAGLQLLINMLATVAALAVLICLFQAISGAHFNPAVSLSAMIQGELPKSEAASYVTIQIVGAIAGATVANIMFGLPAWSTGTFERGGMGVLLGEVVATAGLILAIGILVRTNRTSLVALVIPAWIGAAYFFTASTSFANPAVTIGRAFTDSFTGISPTSVAPFIAAQLVGALIGMVLILVFYSKSLTPKKKVKIN